MFNPRITKKEWGLIIGALRRAFSRSDLRRNAVAKTVSQHSDPSRPRVKTWCLCPACRKHHSKSEMQADHVVPVVPTDRPSEDMTPNEIVDRLWCPEANLKAICIYCHKIKSKFENKERAVNRKRRNK